MLAVAYYNIGVEYEHLSDVNEAINYFTQALSVAKIHIGSSNPLTKKIDESK